MRREIGQSIPWHEAGRYTRKIEFLQPSTDCTAGDSTTDPANNRASSSRYRIADDSATNTAGYRAADCFLPGRASGRGQNNAPKKNQHSNRSNHQLIFQFDPRRFAGWHRQKGTSSLVLPASRLQCLRRSSTVLGHCCSACARIGAIGASYKWPLQHCRALHVGERGFAEVFQCVRILTDEPGRLSYDNAVCNVQASPTDILVDDAKGNGVMELLAPITQLASAFRAFVAPRYRPELHYMRGPGPAYARRASTLEARLQSPPLEEISVTQRLDGEHRQKGTGWQPRSAHWLRSDFH